MRSAALFFLILFGMVFVATCTAPSQDQCIQEVTRHYTEPVVGNGVLSSLMATVAGGELYEVTDMYVCKKVTNRITGNTVAYGAFSNVFIVRK